MKVCVIGGGSTYTPELVEGLLTRHDRLPVECIHLVDVSEARLAVLGPLAQRMATRVAGDGVRVEWGTDRVAGVRDSAFVVSQIRVGGNAARERDEQLGREFGLIGQETVGVGGFANALRTIPVALAISRDVAEYAPGAWLLNFTNPAGLVTEAILRHSPVRAIGLCNVPWSFRKGFAWALKTDAESIAMDYVGLNHLSWVREVTADGVDRLGDLGGKPIPNYYVRYYTETETCLGEQRAHPTRASEVEAIEAALLDQYRDPDLAAKPKELEQRGGAYYSETAAALMADLWTDAGTVHVVNVRNDGAIPDLADDVVVETNAAVGSDGTRALATQPLGADIGPLVRTIKDFELLTVEAAVTGDHDVARRALVTNPLGPGEAHVDAVWDRLREVHRGWLGKLDD